MNYTLSDTHFGHKGSLAWPNGAARPFSSIEEMHEYMILCWNSIVTNEDTVYFLGDFAYKASSGLIKYIMSTLNGKIIFIKGNHDGDVLKVNKSIHRFESIHDILNIKLDDKEYVMCHYPLFSWQGKERGSIHLHGHTHGAIQKQNIDIKRYDCGVECNNYTPILINTLFNEKT